MFTQSFRLHSALLVITLLLSPLTPLAAQPKDNAATVYLELFEQLPKSLTEEQQAILSSWKEVELNDDARNLARLYAPAMKSLHRAAVIKNCDWSIRPKSQSPFPAPGLMEYMVKGRELVNAVCLSSRIGFEDKQYNGAIDDLLDLLAFSRYFARGNTMIDYLTSQTSETNATELLATYLLEVQNQEILKVIVQRYDGLPAVVPLSDVFRNEAKVSRSLLEQATSGITDKPVSDKDKKQGQEIITQMDAVSQQMAAIAALPPGKREEAITAFEKKDQTQNRMLSLMGKPQLKVMRAANIGIARQALFRAALDMQVSGVEQLKKHLDPFGSGPFEYEKKENGFELKSKLKNAKGEQISLRVGK
jgi:hypothetical protein